MSVHGLKRAGILSASIFSVVGTAAAQPADSGLFVPVDDLGTRLSAMQEPGASALPDDGLTVHSRRVLADPAAFRALSAALDTGGTITAVRLNLFPGVVAESVIEWADLTANGYSWGGGVAGDPFGSAAMAVNGDVVRGVVRTRGREYEIRRDGGAVLTIREVDRSGLPAGGDDAIPAGPAAAASGVDPEPPVFEDSGRRIDVAFFYTAAAESAEGGSAGIRTLIDLWMADTNAAWRRSGIRHRLNAVYSGRAPHSGTDTYSWICKAPSTCVFTARRYGADLTYTIAAAAEMSDRDEFCGRAYYYRPSMLDPLGGMGGVQCGPGTFAHEIGHNHGASHDRYEISAACVEDGVPPDQCFPTDTYGPPYQYGYVNQLGFGSRGDRRLWYTIMVYPTQCNAEGVGRASPMRFSNPRQRWRADPLGVYGSVEVGPYSSGGDAARRGPADAARTHREAAFGLANITVRERPDLVVKRVRFVDDEIPEGGAAVLEAVVGNLGTPMDAADNAVEAFAEERLSGRWRRISGAWAAPIPALGADQRASVRVVLEMTSSTASRDFRLCADAADRETLTANNCSEPVRPPVPLSLSDVAVESTLPEDAALAGSQVTATMRVRNFSRSFGSPEAQLSLYYLYQDYAVGGTIEIEKFSVPALPRSGSHTFMGTLNVVRSYGFVYACIYPTGAAVPDPVFPGDDAECTRALLRGVSDLDVTISGPARVTAGSVFTIYIRVKNYLLSATPSGSFELLQNSPSDVHSTR